MQKRSSKKRQDINELASSIAEKATSKQDDNGKNPYAVVLGRLGGLKGGKVTAEKLTSEQRKETARKAARARWSS